MVQGRIRLISRRSRRLEHEDCSRVSCRGAKEAEVIRAFRLTGMSAGLDQSVTEARIVQDWIDCFTSDCFWSMPIFLTHCALTAFEDTVSRTAFITEQLHSLFFSSHAAPFVISLLFSVPLSLKYG